MADGESTIARLQAVFSGVDEVSPAVAGMGRAMGGFVKRTLQSIGFLKAGLAAVGVAAVLAFRKSITAFAGLDEAIREVSTLLPETREELAGVENQVVALSTRVPELPAQLTRGVYQAVSAGARNTADALQLVETASKAAVAGLTDTATAVDAITTLLNAYQLEATEATRISDVLFTTVEQGKVRFPELAKSIGNVATSAALTGTSIEELGASIATLTKFGVDATRASTALNRLLLSVANASENQREAVEELGLEWSVAALRAKGLSGFLQEVREATDGNVDALAEIFPRIRAARAAFILAGEGASTFRQTLGEMRSASGATEDAFQTMNQTLGNQFGLLRNQINVIWTEFGEKTLPPIVDLLTTINRLFRDDIDAQLSVLQRLGRTGEAALLQMDKQLTTTRENLEATQDALESTASEMSSFPSGLGRRRGFPLQGLPSGEELLALPPASRIDQARSGIAQIGQVLQENKEISDAQREGLQREIERRQTLIEQTERQQQLQTQAKVLSDERLRNLRQQSENLSNRIENLRIAGEATAAEREELQNQLQVVRARLKSRRAELQLQEAIAATLVEEGQTREEVAEELADTVTQIDDLEARSDELNTAERVRLEALRQNRSELSRVLALMDRYESAQKALNALLEDEEEGRRTVLDLIQDQLERIERRSQRMDEVLPGDPELSDLLGTSEEVFELSRRLADQFDEMGLSIREAVAEEERLSTLDRKLTDSESERLQKLRRLLDLQARNADLVDRTADSMADVAGEVPDEQLDQMRRVLREMVAQITGTGVQALSRIRDLSDQMVDLNAISADTADELVRMAAAGDQVGALTELVGRAAESVDDISTEELDRIFGDLLPDGNDQLELLIELVELWAEALELPEERVRAIKNQLREAAEEGEGGLVDAFDGVSNAARGLLDTARAVDAIGENAEKAIRSVINLADSLSSIFQQIEEAGGLGEALSTTSGALSFLGAAGSAIGTFLNIGQALGAGVSQEEIRRRREQTEELAELNRSLADLRESVDALEPALQEFRGEELAAFQDVLGDLQTEGRAAKFVAGDLIHGLNDLGVSFNRLLEFGEALGIEMDDLEQAFSGGKVNARQMRDEIEKLQEAIREVRIERITEGFSNQLSLLRQEFELFDIEDPVAQLQRLRDLFVEFTDLEAGGVGADLIETIENANLESARGRQAFEDATLELFRMIQRGEIEAGALGQLTLEQFRELISEQEGLLDQIAENTGEVANRQGVQVREQVTQTTGLELLSRLDTSNFWLQRISEKQLAPLVAELTGGVKLAPPSEDRMNRMRRGDGEDGVSLSLQIESIQVDASGRDSPEEVARQTVDAMMEEIVDQVDEQLADRLRQRMRSQGRTTSEV